MAGINRLGKAAPRPGSLRPVDPTRHRVTDFFSEKVDGSLESDRDYQRAVQDIEDAQQTQGWLFGRGAFDKTDLLYLRDQEEKSRHTEIELHDREVQAYARLRLQSEKQRATSGAPSTSGLSVIKKIEKDRSRQAPKALQRIVKVKAGSSAAATPSQLISASPAPDSTPPHEPAGAPAAGLTDLLGAYGSASDSDDDHSNGGPTSPSTAAHPASRRPPVAVPADVTLAAATDTSCEAHWHASGMEQRTWADDELHGEDDVDYGT